ncbi:MAG: cytochrome C assembly family protein [Gammaproteobacteria bacterium]|jgi:ABC-type uncharacterized transport system permease subunit
MHTSSTALAAIVLYLAASLRIALPSARRATASPHKRTQAIVLLIVAALTHALVLYATVGAAGGFDLGIFNAASVAGWVIGTAVLAIMFWRPVDSLALVIFPAVAVMLGLAVWFPHSRIMPAATPFGLKLHIVLSIIAYALFAIAAVQAIYLGVADYKLRNHKPILDFLPPLPTMEVTLFQLTGVAFAALTVSLALGVPYVGDVQAQHLVHKIVFSLLAWGIFAWLLVGRWRFGWRGPRAIKFVIAGFVLLALGFFGTKVVLELILHRV